MLSPWNLKISKYVDSLTKCRILLWMLSPWNLKTNRLLWFYVRSKPQNLKNKQNSVIICRNFCGMLSPWNLKISKYVDSLTKCRILLGCCRLGNLKTDWSLGFYVLSKTSNTQKMKNCCELLSKLLQSLDLKNLKTIRLMWPQLQTKNLKTAGLLWPELKMGTS